MNKSVSLDSYLAVTHPLDLVTKLSDQPNRFLNWKKIRTKWNFNKIILLVSNFFN